MVVIDASLMLAHLLPDEQSDVVDTILSEAVAQGSIAPSLLPYEVANALQMKVRRGLISKAHRDALFDQFEAFELEIAGAADRLDAVIGLADAHRLTIYNAAYLELALRSRAALGSLDAELRQAAVAEGVVVMPA